MRILNVAWIACWVLGVLTLPGLPLSAAHSHKNFPSSVSVASYLPEWRYEGANWVEISKHSTHVILFSLEPTRQGGIAALDRLPRTELLEQALQAATQFGAKVLICFGGNGRSSGFSAMVRSDRARQKFVAAAKQLVVKYQLHGIDYNWEYPGCVPSISIDDVCLSFLIFNG